MSRDRPSPPARRARAVMVCGTTSGAGKSFLATALARWYARRGLKVAPFKAQNMSNNARVVEGGEMGSAQYFQALAARARPDVRMNPVLLKPERDTHSQVILLGRRRDDLAALEWRARAALLWDEIRSCLDHLMADHEVLVIEGAGSPAEINLAASDIVNMRVAAEAGAATLLVCDIDRGGAFAHLYGTHRLLPPGHRRLIRGFVLNKFRGDAALLAPGPADLESLTGVPTLAVLPLWRDHGLPQEDGVFDVPRRAAAAATRLSVAIVAYPYISNLDEFAPLEQVAGLSLRWAREPRSIEDADLLILPGSKSVAADLDWLRAHGLDGAIGRHIAAQKPTLAVCGGLQMLGTEIHDPHGVEGAGRGLGLMPYVTEFRAGKLTRRERHRLTGTGGFWEALSGLELDGYQIRHGETRLLPFADAVSSEAGAANPAQENAPHVTPGSAIRAVLPDGCGWQRGQTLALYVHGLFECTAVMKALFGADTRTLDETLDGLADFVERHFGAETLMSLLAPD